MALPSYRNRVGNLVTGTPGTGTITLDAADTAHQSFSAAYGANANVDLLIEEGSAWEIARDCTYTHSGTTVTRGTLEASSTGSALDLTSAAKVYVIESAERIRKGVSGYLEHSSHDGTAAVTGVVGTLHVFTGLTADRVFTLPAAASAGDRIGVAFPVGSASYEILLKSASGDKINNVDCSSTEWSRLFIAGETVIFRCIEASTVDWIVEYDGRIPVKALMRLSTSATTSATGGTWYYPTEKSGAWTADTDNCSCTDTATDKVTIRRSGKFNLVVAGIPIVVTSPPKFTLVGLEKNGDGVMSVFSSGVSQVFAYAVGSALGTFDNVPLAANDYLRYKFNNQDTDKDLTGATGYTSYFSVLEVL